MQKLLLLLFFILMVMPISVLRAEVNDGAGIVAEPSSDSGPRAAVTVDDVQKAYYIIPSCRVADNISSCPKPEDEEKEQKETDYEDFSMYIGDESPMPVRALMPWPESSLQLSFQNTVYRFSGVMIACIDHDLKNRKIRIRIFQALVDVRVTYLNGKTEVHFISKNKRGLGNSSIRVTEGSVAVTTPWPCDDCFAEKTFLVETGECYEFKYRPEPSEEEIDLPEIKIEPPPAVDAMVKN